MMIIVHWDLKLKTRSLLDDYCLRVTLDHFKISNSFPHQLISYGSFDPQVVEHYLMARVAMTMISLMMLIQGEMITLRSIGMVTIITLMITIMAILQKIH